MEIFSNQYYEFLDRFVQTKHENEKVLGKYYTNFNVAVNMIKELLEKEEILKISSSLKVIDPFCGDGRLIVILLRELETLGLFYDIDIQITIWDIDKEAMVMAKERIEDFAKSIQYKVTVDAMVTDAFVAYIDEENKYDICVTNPPWGLLKPLKIFNEICTEGELEQYKNSIALYDDYIKNEFMISQPTSKFGKWGTNLGRCGLEVALKLIRRSGLCAFVSPASLFNDQISNQMRKWIFDSYKIYSINHYPAEAKLYGSADVSSITAVVEKGLITEDFQIKTFNKDMHKEVYTIDKDILEYIKRNNYVIPLEIGMSTMPLLMHLEQLPTMLEYCKKNNMRFIRELDETRVTEKLNKTGKIRFAKGYMVNRYLYVADDLYLDEEKMLPPETVYYPKLVWRDVSRTSQKRRIKATLLSPNCIAGNSLGAIYSIDNYIDKLKMLLAIMNSFVFEFQARSILVSNHVSAGVIKKVHIPELKIDNELLNLIDVQLNGGDVDSLIEVYVAKMYGLSKDQFTDLISIFDLEVEDKTKLFQAIELIDL